MVPHLPPGVIPDAQLGRQRQLPASGLVDDDDTSRDFENSPPLDGARFHYRPDDARRRLEQGKRIQLELGG